MPGLLMPKMIFLPDGQSLAASSPPVAPGLTQAEARGQDQDDQQPPVHACTYHVQPLQGLTVRQRLTSMAMASAAIATAAATTTTESC